MCHFGEMWCHFCCLQGWKLECPCSCQHTIILISSTVHLLAICGGESKGWGWSVRGDAFLKQLPVFDIYHFNLPFSKTQVYHTNISGEWLARSCQDPVPMSWSITWYCSFAESGICSSLIITDSEKKSIILISTWCKI